MHATGNDSGKYICHISDGVEEWIADVVIDRPKFIVEVRETFALVNDLTILTYDIFTSLPVNIRIKKEDQFYEPTEVNNTIVSFQIDKTSFQDTGTYVCIATNILGQGSSSNTLHIGELPVILVRETSYKAQRTTDVTFHCDISNFTKVEWEKRQEIPFL
ncbi:TTN [Mytilus edulis]|uniref:TTN n=1 Tax=Mytilus edulis TaxID=6550 RepID=A0A8S3QBJ9_MYTED|nr:TTN [Mytilus edulis]